MCLIVLDQPQQIIVRSMIEHKGWRMKRVVQIGEFLDHKVAAAKEIAKTDQNSEEIPTEGPAKVPKFTDMHIMQGSTGYWK